jgi:hypothetical protein
LPLNICDGFENQQERGFAFDNYFSKDRASEVNESLNKKTKIKNGIEVGAKASTNVSGSDKSDKFIHRQMSPMITIACNSKLSFEV